MAKLVDVFPLVRNGASIRQTDGATGIPITRIETISNREIDRNKFGYANIIDGSKYKDYILQDGDILMSHINSEKHLGKVALYRKQENEQIIHGMNLLMLRANPSVIFPSYATYFFETPAFLMQIRKITKKSVNQASFTVTALKEIEIPLPSLDEQRRIAAVLDKVSGLIAKRREQLDKLDRLVKSRFVEQFGDQRINPYGWQQSSIGACCTLKSGTSLPAEKENEGGTIPYVKVGDMNYSGNEYYITTSSRFVTEQTAGAGIFPVGTVIFPKRGGAIGTNKKRLTTLPICADLNVMGVTAGKQVSPQYLMAYFDMIDLGTLDNGSSVPQINNKDIAPLTICIPPMELQQQFAGFVKQIDKSKLTIQQSLDKLEALKKALMQQYFGSGGDLL